MCYVIVYEYPSAATSWYGKWYGDEESDHHA